MNLRLRWQVGRCRVPSMNDELAKLAGRLAGSEQADRPMDCRVADLCRSSNSPQIGDVRGMVTTGYCRHPSGGDRKAMSTQTEEDMRTALRQAGVIAAVSGERSLRRILGLAHEIYDALILLRPEDRARRIHLIDTIFGSPARGSEHRHGDL